MGHRNLFVTAVLFSLCPRAGLLRWLRRTPPGSICRQQKFIIYCFTGENVPSWSSCHQLQMKENVVWLCCPPGGLFKQLSLLTLLSGEFRTPFRMLKLWDGMDSLATLTAAIDQRGMTCSRPAKKAQPEAENSENESRETGKLRSGCWAKMSWRHPNKTVIRTICQQQRNWKNSHTRRHSRVDSWTQRWKD